MRLRISTVMATVLLSGTILAADFTGRWKLNLSKTQNSDIATETLKIDQTGPNSYGSTIDIVTKSGKKSHRETNRFYDGQEHPMQGEGVSPGFTQIFEMGPSSTRKITVKEDGKVVRRSHPRFLKTGKS